MEFVAAAALTLVLLASIAAAVFAFRAAGAARDGSTIGPFSDVVRKENELARAAAEEHARGLRQESRDIVAAGMKATDDRVASIGAKLDSDIDKMRNEATLGREALRGQIAQRLDESATVLKQQGDTMANYLRQIGEQQKERLEKLAAELKALTEKSEKGQEALRQTVELRLDAIREENAKKLEEMRQTVDEKLQSTLEQRLGESFNRVVEQLERVHNGLGEMKTLAAGVGDLKKVLSNVSVRGSIAEAQLGALLEQFLSREQYIEDAVVKEGSREHVEFAIKMPGRGSEGDVLLPIDAKFPTEDYNRLLAAADTGDPEAVADARKALESTVRLCAKTICEKYINPPRTTDFAILFLGTEGLYAEVLRKPGFFEQLQREYRVVLTGPVTLTALLNALQMGFRSLAIEKRSSEVWQVLAAVRTEFGNYNSVVDKLARNLSTAAKSVEDLGRRTRVMGRKLKDVEQLEPAAAQTLLGLPASDTAAPDDDEPDSVAAE
ncbi:MAG TPA: DNA recombination protein RmuC [Micropepsaceae bacterium]|nr:DNA recombination protein RmuC [Micropepsaceae bacterium]